MELKVPIFVINFKHIKVLKICIILILNPPIIASEIENKQATLTSKPRNFQPKKRKFKTKNQWKKKKGKRERTVMGIDISSPPRVDVIPWLQAPLIHPASFHSTTHTHFNSHSFKFSKPTKKKKNFLLSQKKEKQRKIVPVGEQPHPLLFAFSALLLLLLLISEGKELNSWGI